MGGSYEESGSLLPQDLKVTIKESSLLVPSEESHKTRKAMFLSNVDQVLNFDVQTVHFFRPNKEFPPEIVTEKLRKALVRAMDDDYYEFLAGRLRLNPSSGRLEVDCNGEGAGFVTATSEFTLEELGDLIYPNQAFAQLVASQLDQSLPKHDQPLCVFQITSFKCGGFAMGISTNHTTFDGLSFKTFLENLASLLHEKPLSAPPCNDRTLLKARTPPRVTFPHHELVQFQDSDTTVFQATSEHLDFNIFKLSSQQIQKLKDKALETNNTSGCVRVTGFNVVTALVWRCKALSFAQEEEEEEDLEKESTILYAVDIRRRLNPQLPSSYTGNAVLTAYAKAKRKALLQEPFGRIVEMVGEGAMRVTDEYARSAIDWGELYKGFPHGEVLVSSWWKLGFEEVQYPWGKPKYSCPVVYHRKDIILLFPDIDADSKGVYVLAALPSKEMAKFQHWFQHTLS